MLGLSESDRVTSALVVVALDAATLRHQAIAKISRISIPRTFARSGSTSKSS